FWQRQHAQGRAPGIARSPLVLTGDRQRDRRAILERARDDLLSSGLSSPIHLSLEEAARMDRQIGGAPLPSLSTFDWRHDPAVLLGEIGIALLPLDPEAGTQAVERSIEMVASSAEHGSGIDPLAPGRSRTGLLLRLARSLKPYPGLAEKMVQSSYDWAQRTNPATSRALALCLFAREAADIDPVRAP